MSAADDFNRALLGMAERGERPRCGEWQEGDPWLSEDFEMRASAARWCAGCPVLAECDAAAVEQRVTFGVWAGRDWTSRTKPDKRGRP